VHAERPSSAIVPDHWTSQSGESERKKCQCVALDTAYQRVNESIPSRINGPSALVGIS